jgi:pSer/pThr/pTyr-binding forkhead associated (FHA) protein
MEETLDIWEWLSDEGNQRAFAFIGSGIAAVATSGWAVFKYIKSKRIAGEKSRTQEIEHEPLIKIANFEEIKEYDKSINQLRERIEPRARTKVGGFYFPVPEPGKPTAILIGLSGPVEGRQFPIEKEIFHIGASHENDLHIAEDDYVSGNHASLLYTGGSLFIYDNESRNKTYVNQNEVTYQGCALELGDRIRIGMSTLELGRT